jgi:hypothetical protein
MEQPEPAAAPGDQMGAEGNEFSIDFTEEDYADDPSVTDAVANLYQTQNQKGMYCWLDTELFKKEIVYANALADAYENGDCPDEVREEAMFLANMRLYESGFRNNREDLAYPYGWEQFLAALNSLYNLCAVGNEGLLQEKVISIVFLSTGKLILHDTDFDFDDPEFSHFDGIFYDTAKLIHEACCDGDHSQTNALGYSYCSDLDAFQAMLHSENANQAFFLRIEQ